MTIDDISAQLTEVIDLLTLQVQIQSGLILFLGMVFGLLLVNIIWRRL